MKRKILLSIFAFFLIIATVAFAVDYYTLTINVYDSDSNPLTADYIHVYDSGNTLVCHANNVQTKTCILPQGVYSYEVFESAYDLETGTLTLNTHRVKYVYMSLDTTSPAILTLDSPTHPNENNYYNNDDPVLEWTASDGSGSGIDGFSYEFDQTSNTDPGMVKEIEETTDTLTFSNTGEGTWYFHIRPVDNADNWGSVEHYTINIDTAGPVISGCTVSPVSGSQYVPNQDYTFSCTITDNGSGLDTVEFEFDLSTYTLTQIGDVFTAVLNDLDAGSYDYVWTATDNANFETQHSGTYAIVAVELIDQIHLAIDGVEADATFWAPATYVVDASKDVSVGTLELERNSVVIWSGSGPETIDEIDMGPDTYVYTLTFSDPNYFAAPVTRTAQVDEDNEAPQFSNLFENPADPATYAPGQVYTFSVDITDNAGIDTVEFEFDGVIYSGTDIVQTVDTFTVTFTDLAAGFYNYEWIATDINTLSDTLSDDYTVNRAIPEPHLSLNGVENDLTITYDTESTALGWFTIGDAGAVTRLERDGIEVVNPETATLDVGDYVYAFFYEESENYTSDSVSWILTVVKATDGSFMFDLAPPSPITYGTQTVATCDVANAEQSGLILIERDSVDVTSENQQPITLDAGTYTYECSIPETTNYLAQTSGPQSYTVDRATSDLNLIFSPAPPIIYGTPLTIGCTVGNVEQIPELIVDGSPVSNPYTEILAAGTHQAVCNVAETTNYLANSVNSQFMIDQATPVLDIQADPGWIVNYPQSITVNGTESNTGDDDLAYVLARDGIPVTNPDTITDTGTYNYEFSTLGGENYTAGTTGIQTATIFKQAPVMMFVFTPTSPVEYGTETTVYCSSDSTEQSVILYRNSIDVTATENGIPVTLDAGDHEYFCEVLESANYEAASIGPRTYTVEQATLLMNLEIDGQADNVTRTFDDTFSTAEGWATGIVGQQDLLFELYVNGIVDDTGSPATSSVIEAGVYNFTYVTSGNQNYSGESITRWLTIDQANPINETNPSEGVLHLSLSDGIVTVEADLTVAEGTQTTATGWMDVPDGTLILYLNQWPLVSLIDIQTLPTGAHNYTLVLTGATNYLDASITRWVLVADEVPPMITIIEPTNGANTTNETWLIATTDEPATCYFGPETGPIDPMDSVITDHSTFLTGLPLGENTYYVNCTDAFGNNAEASVTWTVGYEQIIEVEMGWNLISLSVVPFDPVLTSDTSLWGTNYIIQHYDNPTDSWLEFDSSDPTAATLNEVVPDLGYWLYVDQNRTITIFGADPGVRTIDLLVEQNMVGWTALDEKRMDLALWYIIENITSVQCQDTTDVSIQVLRTCDVNTEYFESGKGYFINVSGNTTWEYPRNIAPVANAGLDKTVSVIDSVTLDGSGSYDLDGQIVSWEWTLNGVTKSGEITSYGFGSTGTFTATLNVTDDQGATDTDEVTITVTHGGGGYGGGGGGYIPSTGFIQISLTAPESVTVAQGAPYTFTAIVTNIGHADVYDITLSSNPDWISIAPGRVNELVEGEFASFEVTVTLPEGVIGTNYMTLTAFGNHPNATISSAVEIEVRGNPAQCGACPQADSWTACNVNGTQTRTVYTCDSDTNYECVETTEERNCGGITGYFLVVTDNPLLSGIIALLIIGTIGGLIYGHKKGKLKGLKGFGKNFGKKLKFWGKKTPIAKKDQGIDFSIEYKKSFDGDVTPTTL